MFVVSCFGFLKELVSVWGFTLLILCHHPLVKFLISFPDKEPSNSHLSSEITPGQMEGGLANGDYG